MILLEGNQGATMPLINSYSPIKFTERWSRQILTRTPPCRLRYNCPMTLPARKLIPELFEVEKLAQDFKGLVHIEKLSEVSSRGYTMPLHGLTIGSQDKTKPVFALFGGVHGLERVGSHVLIAYLQHLLYRLSWDKELQALFEHCRLVSIPIINPLGMAFNRRSNANGVDLMRNSPVDAEEGRTVGIISGHTISPKLPWYRGDPQNMEVETKTVIEFCQREIFQSEQVISLDLHSGFGLRDRLWYPWAKSLKPFPHETDVLRLKNLFDKTFPYHIYIIEHQADSYMTNGDMWDHIYQLYTEQNPKGVYLPLTLEMGSWLWVKKNPLQAFNPLGYFNPVKKHRYSRVMRRHLHLMEFLLRANLNNQAWLK